MMYPSSLSQLEIIAFQRHVEISTPWRLRIYNINLGKHSSVHNILYLLLPEIHADLTFTIYLFHSNSFIGFNSSKHQL